MRISDLSSDVCSSDLIMLTPDHPNALWLAELYRPLRPEAASPELSAVELDRLRAEHVATHMARMSPDLIIHTGGVRLAATGDMAFRSEERRGGKKCVWTCRSRWAP